MDLTTLKRINTDVLVIGGGAAGIRAAIEADAQGANVLIVVKGNFCETGSTFYPLSPGWGMQASFGYADPYDSSNEHLKEVLNAGLDMRDKKMTEILAFEAPGRLIDLEKCGIAFKKIEGKYIQVGGCFSARPRGFLASDTNNIVTVFKNEKINEKAETTLAGLYACGEVAGGPHGADRLGGNMIAATQVFGARAGKYAAERTRDIEKVIIKEEQVKNEYENMLQIMNRKAGYRPGEVLRRIQKVMWDKVLVSRNEKGLKGCITELQQIYENELPNLFIENSGRLSEVFEIRNLLQLGQIVANAALTRKESRGSHYRSDFPYMEADHFSRSILIRKEGTQIIAK